MTCFVTASRIHKGVARRFAGPLAWAIRKTSVAQIPILCSLLSYVPQEFSNDNLAIVRQHTWRQAHPEQSI